MKIDHQEPSLSPPDHEDDPAKPCPRCPDRDPLLGAVGAVPDTSNPLPDGAAVCEECDGWTPDP